MYEYEYYYYDYANYYDEYDYDYLEVWTDHRFGKYLHNFCFCGFCDGWFGRNQHQEAGRGEQQLKKRKKEPKEMKKAKRRRISKKLSGKGQGRVGARATVTEGEDRVETKTPRKLITKEPQRKMQGRLKSGKARK